MTQDPGRVNTIMNFNPASRDVEFEVQGLPQFSRVRRLIVERMSCYILHMVLHAPNLKFRNAAGGRHMNND